MIYIGPASPYLSVFVWRDLPRDNATYNDDFLEPQKPNCNLQYIYPTNNEEIYIYTYFLSLRNGSSYYHWYRFKDEDGSEGVDILPAYCVEFLHMSVEDEYNSTGYLNKMETNLFVSS